MLHVIAAEYAGDYKINISFSDGVNFTANFRNKIFSDQRKIVMELKDPNLFRNFSIRANTITWSNGLDFAPEFLQSLKDC
ncbi:MAG: DUF2442 domain-containing protein [Treponema sp.]|nr:DUF2442 domain-containing protein [Treponema sp.]